MIMRALLIGLVTSSLWCPAHGTLMADTSLGLTRGHVVSVFNGEITHDVNVWYNIPYAKPPVGDLRFKNPVAADPWVGVYDADSQGNACPQKPIGVLLFTHANWTVSEDCLNLNVYAPSEEGGEPYPVMVYIHGGAYQQGANIQYPGHFLASRGLVVVNINYRLGNLGFAYTGDDAAPGNAGLFDQKMALEFVRDNIRAFGGDPNHVTIFGLSAGGSSVGLHLVSTQTQGLFHQAQMESGSDINLWALNSPPSHPEDYTVQLAESLACPTQDTQAMIDCLRTIPASNITDFSITCTPGYFCLGMAPVIDGPGGFVPDWPGKLREDKNFQKLPTLSGICRDDGSLYTIALIPSSLRPRGFNRTEFVSHLGEDVLSLMQPQLTPQVYDEVFNAFDHNYSPWPYINDGQLNRQAFNEIITDAGFGAAWDYVIKSQSQFAPSYGYIFDYRSEGMPPIIPNWTGVFHMGERPYVWGTPLLKLNPQVYADAEFSNLPLNYTENDMLYAIYFQTMISNFAKFGDPTPGPAGVSNPFDPGSTRWSAFTWEATNYLYAARAPYVAQRYNQRDFAFYKAYIPYLTGIGFDGRPVTAASTTSPRSVGGHSAHTRDTPTKPFSMQPVWQLLEEYTTLLAEG